MRSILKSLPLLNRNVLMFLLAHLDKVSIIFPATLLQSIIHLQVADSSPTAMTHANLAIVWLPALIQPQFKDLEHLTSGVDSYKVCYLHDPFIIIFFTENGTSSSGELAIDSTIRQQKPHIILVFSSFCFVVSILSHIFHFLFEPHNSDLILPSLH